MAQNYGVPLVGCLPLNISIREDGDSGCPTMIANPDGEIAQIYKKVARKVALQIAGMAKDMTNKFPTIVVEKL